VLRYQDVLWATLLLVDGDIIGCYGSDAAHTPALDAFTQQGVLFRDAQSPAPLTLPSHTTMMTGTDPYLHGVHDNGLFVVPPSARTLAERLRADDYWTGAVIGAYPLVRRFGLVYDISDFSATLSVLGRVEKTRMDEAFETTFLLQRRINRVARRLRLRLEKYLGDGAFYSSLESRPMLVLAIAVQRFSAEFVADDRHEAPYRIPGPVYLGSVGSATDNGPDEAWLADHHIDVVAAFRKQGTVALERLRDVLDGVVEDVQIMAVPRGVRREV